MLIDIVTAAKRFGDRAVFSDLSAKLPHGRVSALVGPSGSGKTTLLMAIAGQIPLDSGAVEWIEPDGTSRPPDASDVAWVTQVSHLLGHRSCRENVALAALARGLSWADSLQHADDLLRRFGLASVAHTDAWRLSGGERQRVSVCRALVTNRPLVLADEPSANLDAYHASLVLEAFGHIAAHGNTVVVATHDPAVVKIADHVESLR